MKYFIILAALASVESLAASTIIYNSLPYRERADSPFAASIVEGNSVVEDFEDGALNTVGMSIRSTQAGISNPLRWSVDEDDGVLDNLGRGYSWNTEGYSLLDDIGYTIEVSFARNEQGQYPTHAGLVLLGFNTSSVVQFFRQFKAYDANGSLISGSEIIALIPVANGSNDSFSTVGDRFFGITHEAGISRILSSGAHIDHIQFGYNPIPEPGISGMLLATLAGMGLTFRRRG